MTVSLLPSTSGLFEKAIEQAHFNRWDFLNAVVPTIRSAKLVNPPPSFLPYLVYEYGLGELTPYLPNLYTLIDEGIQWQRVRGTPASIAKGLSWLGYSAAVEEAWFGRNFWNSIQLRLTALPSSDNPDLSRIEGITGLSLPERSKLRRAVFQYDVDALQCDYNMLDNALLDEESGIVLAEGGTVWSFGRTTEVNYALTEAEGIAIGNWIDPPESDQGSLLWVDATFSWASADFPWALDAATARRALMTTWFEERLHYFTFRDQGGAIIGHRRCRACKAVSQELNGRYVFAGSSYEPSETASYAYIEAMTDFGDESGMTAAQVELTVGAALAAGVKAGKRWLAPSDLVGGRAIAVTPKTIPLRTTVRDQIKILMRF